MAEITTLVSDLSGDRGSAGDPVKPWTFSLDGETTLRIDLTVSEREKWLELNGPYLRAARLHEPPKTRTGSPRPRVRTEGGQAKEWARGHGADLSLRGPCPEDVLEAYKKDDPGLMSGRVNGATVH